MGAWLAPARSVANPAPADPPAAAAERAERGSSAEERAAQAFDEGVAAFRRAEYRNAALAFLRADELLPSSDALSNAIAAARRANEHLLVVSAASRALARESESPELAASAREAVAQAERHLSRLELTCSAPIACQLTLDGVEVNPGVHYALPGLHRVTASAGENGSAARRIETAAGAAYRVELEPLPGATTSDERALPARTGAPQPRIDHATSARPLSPAVFWTSVVVTGALAGATVWSGVDVVLSRDELPARPTPTQADADTARIRRTDVLLAATVLVAAATTYAGMALVDWQPDRATSSAPLGFSF